MAQTEPSVGGLCAFWGRAATLRCAWQSLAGPGKPRTGFPLWPAKGWPLPKANILIHFGGAV